MLQVSESVAMRNVCHTNRILFGWVGGGLYQLRGEEFKHDAEKVGRQTQKEDTEPEKR